MDDTHTEETREEPGGASSNDDAVESLAAMDPADAPAAAEGLAARLSSDLESAGATAPDPVQLRADLDDGSAS